MSKKKGVFISYSHQDVDILEELKEPLAYLEINGLLTTWDDTVIASGSVWRNEINRFIKECRVAVFLVSSSFLSSRFILEQELPPLLDRANRANMEILTVVVDVSIYERTPIAEYQAINDPSQPLKTLEKLDRQQVYVDLAERIMDALDLGPADLMAQQDDLEGFETHTRLLLVMAYLSNSEPCQFKQVTEGTGLERKYIHECLDQLRSWGFVEREQIKKPSKRTLWRVSDSGARWYQTLEKTWLYIIQNKK
ncbi:MAG: TIR domain-containing protein [Bacteroidota bacterium]